MTALHVIAPVLAGRRATAALLALVNENLILRLQLAQRDPALADLPGLDPAQFAFAPMTEGPRDDRPQIAL
jgi:hypothetical protein